VKKYFWAVLLVVLLCFAFACRDKAAMAELDKYKAQAKVEEQNKVIANREWEAWSKGDFEAFKEVVAPEFVWYMPSSSAKSLSREETIEFGKRMHNGYPDVTFSIEEMFAVGDRVIVRYIMRGTNQGEFEGIPATGKKIEIGGIMIHRIKNGKTVEDREEADMFGLMQQLGMELKPIEAKRK
jgi:steroid delta-isomerase-like uncharacterized protein